MAQSFTDWQKTQGSTTSPTVSPTTTSTPPKTGVSFEEWSGNTEAPQSKWGKAVSSAIHPTAFSQHGLSEFKPGLVDQLKGRFGDFMSAMQPQGKTPLGTIGRVAVGEPILQGAGAVAGGINDVIGAGLGFLGSKLWEATPESVKKPIVDKITEASKDPTVQKGLDALKQGVQSYDAWKEEHPEAAKNVEAAFNIAILLPGGSGSVVEKGAANLLGKGAEIAGASAEKQITKDALQVIAPKLTKKEIVGELEKGAGQTGAFGKTTLAPGSHTIDIAKSVQDVVKVGQSFTKNIEAISTKIADVGNEVGKELEKYNAIFNKKTLQSYLDKAKEESRVIFGSDKALESAYNAVVDEFMKQMEKNSGNLTGLWNARKNFDNVIREKFPGLLENPARDAIRGNAIKDVRQAANQFIADQLPAGNAFKDRLREMSNMYDAISHIAAANAEKVNRGVISRAADFIKKNPLAPAIAVIGLDSPTLLHIVTNPAVFGTLATGAAITYGKKVVTSQAFKKGLTETLKIMEKSVANTSGARMLQVQSGIEAIRALLDHFKELESEKKD